MPSPNLTPALDALRAGKMIILVDDPLRENEGDFIMAAEYATPEAINFMLAEARGVLCVSMTGDALDRLDIPLMVTHNTALHRCPFAVSIDAATAEGSGSSAHDRAKAIRLLASDTSMPSDFAKPGHVFPLRGHPDGIQARRGHTEGSLALMQMAGLKPASVICEILNADGSMARPDDLAKLAAQHNMPLVTLDDICTQGVGPLC